MTLPMTVDREMGVAAELDFILDPGWSMTRMPTGFRVGPPTGANELLTSRENLAAVALKISTFIGVGKIVETKENDDGTVRVIIWWQADDGSEIIIDREANQLPNHRPQPFVGDTE